ncbi:ribonuclease H-like domain-containing protein [Tanacetum coccineum]
MTGSDTLNPPIPLSEKLSLEYFFEKLCESYDVDKFLRAPADDISTSDSTPLTLEELKVDKIVLSWILFTLSVSLRARLVVACPKSAKEVLTSLGAHVNDEDIFHYALNGLPDTYNQVCGYMHWKDTFPNFKLVRSLLLNEEMRIKSKMLASPMDSSYPMVFVANSSNNLHSSSTPQGNLGMNMSNNGTTVPLPNTVAPNVPASPKPATHVPQPTAYYAGPNPIASIPVGPITPTTAHSGPLVYAPPTVGYSTVGPAQASQPGSNTVTPNPGQATVLPHAFTVRTLQDPSTDNDCIIEFDSFGFSVKDFKMRWVLLRCDSAGDLYPVTAPSPIPQALLVSQYTWHQRLRHPEGDVLRRLVSNKVISSNKEKPLVLCHACQLGKHVRLLFISSSTTVSSSFDIVHSDVWTSPILSLSDDLDINPPSISVSQIPPPDTSHHTPPNSLPYAAQPVTPTMAQSPIPPSNDGPTHPYSPITTPTAQDHSTEHAPNIISDPLVNLNPDSVHHMVTRFCVGSNRPVERLTLHVSSVSPLLRSYREAFNDVNWQNAMRDEYNALIKNSTWTLARLVANGSTQLEGVDVDDTFSPVVKPGTICTVLSLAASRHWPVHQLDVKNAFLHGDLSETVYMHQPPVFWYSAHPNYVCLLQRSLYGLKQAPRAWFQRFASYISRKYAVEIIERADMVNCNPKRTPVDTESKLGTTGDVVSDPTMYRSLAGSLQYLTFTRPDISYAVQQDCLHMHDPWEPYFSALKWILCYVCEAEYRGVANVVIETCWLRNLLRELHTPLSSATLVYCDNVSAVYLSCNPVQHQRTKHIEIDIHFVCDLVAGEVQVLHVPFRY